MHPTRDASCLPALLLVLGRPVAAADPSPQPPVILQDSYVGREPDAPWRKDAEARIEKHRKGDLVVRVAGPGGAAVPDAEISVRMRRHAFHFGTQVQKDLLIDPSGTGELYRKHFLELFNYATVNAFYYMQWKTPQQADKTRAEALKAVQWLQGKGIPMRGHVLVWYFKDDQIEKTPAEIRARVVRHIDDCIGNPGFGGAIGEWDVQNEPFSNSDIHRKLGLEAMPGWFRLARQHAPKARLFLNEAGLCSRMHDKRWAERVAFTEGVVRFLQEKGAPIDGLGLQSHHIESLAPLPEVLRTLDRFAALGVDLQATEYDIRLLPSTADRKADFQARWRTPGPPVPPEMERLEADYLRDYLTAFFSCPSVTAFILWGFWDGKHWLHNAPLLRKDWTLKPAGEAYRELVFRRWWTEAEGRTGADGTFATRGFLGDYEIAVKKGTAVKTVPARLERPGTTVAVVLDAK